MNSTRQRLLMFAGAMFVALLVATLVLSKKGDGGDEARADASGQRITALTPGSSSPKSSPSTDTGVEPVQVNARTLLGGKSMLGLVPDEVEGILDDGGRQPGMLIAAQAMLGDHSYLREAAAAAPNDPEVQYWILAKRVIPEERAAWLEKFKASDPDNALGNYLAAQEAFRTDDFAAGIAELKAATTKGFKDYSGGLREAVRDFYGRSGKFDESSVRDGSARSLATPHVDQIQSLAQRLIEHHVQLVGDERPEEAAELAELGMGMLETVAENSGADAIGSRAMLLLMQERLSAVAGIPAEELEELTAERERIGQLGESVRNIFADSDSLSYATLD